ncbi:serine/arginine repetitive matrix protein 3-like [Sturnira hondurensis]|uniref:serine/arginine repetitive matrix protein 3-like n=1 Tax=Sturnira hondurensis TaxID=192404 RepID=UPI00187996A6|nr:serine/arginine repetitive matrix protein 3-like [Sturnira hondurensis]
MVLGGGGGEAQRRQRWRRLGLGPARRRRRRRRRRPRGAWGGGRGRERARGRAQSGAPSRDSRPVSWRRVTPLGQRRRGAGRGSERRGAEEEGRAAEPRTKGRRGRGGGRPGALGSSHRRSQPERCPVQRRWEGPEPPAGSGVAAAAVKLQAPLALPPPGGCADRTMAAPPPPLLTHPSQGITMVSPRGAAAKAQQLISWDPGVPLCSVPQRKRAENSILPWAPVGNGCQFQ